VGKTIISVHTEINVFVNGVFCRSQSRNLHHISLSGFDARTPKIHVTVPFPEVCSFGNLCGHKAERGLSTKIAHVEKPSLNVAFTYLDLNFISELNVECAQFQACLQYFWNVILLYNKVQTQECVIAPFATLSAIL
jgi:hypothetical protein